MNNKHKDLLLKNEKILKFFLFDKLVMDKSEINHYSLKGKIISLSFQITSSFT